MKRVKVLLLLSILLYYSILLHCVYYKNVCVCFVNVIACIFYIWLSCTRDKNIGKFNWNSFLVTADVTIDEHLFLSQFECINYWFLPIICGTHTRNLPFGEFSNGYRHLNLAARVVTCIIKYRKRMQSRRFAVWAYVFGPPN